MPAGDIYLIGKQFLCLFAHFKEHETLNRKNSSIY